MLSRRFKRRARAAERKDAEINMESLIDLTFRLLVTFMITMPQLEQGVSVHLPQPKADKLPDKKTKPCSVTIDAEGSIYVGKQKVSIEELKEHLSRLQKEDPEVGVLVRGDERQEYGRVMEVVKTSYACKIRRMSLVTKGE